MVSVFLSFFVFKQKSAYEMRISDWSSDVCSSDLAGHRGRAGARAPGGVGAAARRAMAWHLRRPRRVWSRDAGLGDLPRARDPSARAADRKSVVWGKRVSVRGDFGGRRTIENK